MSYTIEDAERMMKNKLSDHDTFQFQCKMCGQCCRNRTEPIVLTGADIFRIAVSLKASMEAVIPKYTHWCIGENSHIPVLLLKERPDGSCRFMSRGRCSIQDCKPAVCAMFPLGRYYNVRKKEYHYFLNPNTCSKGCKGGRIWTLDEWLKEYHIEKNDQMGFAWNKMVVAATNITSKLDKSKIEGNLLSVLFDALYLNYKTDEPYVEQTQRNTKLLLDSFRDKFHLI